MGAVKKPDDEMLPALADQVTAVLLVPRTVAENCCVLPEVRVVLVGETVTLTVDPEGPTAITAPAFLVGSAALVAVTVTLVLLETLGAVNTPPSEIVPAVADHFTVVLVVP